MHHTRQPKIDFPVILAAIFSLFGIIYGFLLFRGPIIWALIGTGSGFGLGVLVKLFTTHGRKRRLHAELREVVLIIACGGTQLNVVLDTLWNNGAFEMSKLCFKD